MGKVIAFPFGVPYRPGLGHREGVAHSVAFKDHDPVSPGHRSLQLRDRLVVPYARQLHSTGDGVSRSSRCLEAPVDLQEHGSGSRQVLRNNSVEDGTRDTTLHDDLAKLSRLDGLFVIVERILVSADLSEEFDVFGADGARSFCTVANLGQSFGPCFVAHAWTVPGLFADGSQRVQLRGFSLGSEVALEMRAQVAGIIAGAVDERRLASSQEVHAHQVHAW
jgi:hypothetical protein